jgi:hypothetical protein
MDSTPVKSPLNKRSWIPVNRRRSPSILRRSPTYLRKGCNSQDNDVEAAARALQNQRQRSYRAAIRRGEQHSPIPSWNTTVANIVEQQGIRVGRGNIYGESRRGGSHNSSRSSSQPRYLAPSGLGTPLYPASPVLSNTSQVDQEDTNDSHWMLPPSNLQGVAFASPSSSTQPPPEALEMGVAEEEWELIQNFHRKLEQDIREECIICREFWFNMGLKSGICRRRTYRDKKKADNAPFLLSRENMMDPGDVPAYLPQLTQIEEILIARVHISLEVRQIRGQQYRYKGHIVNFLRDAGIVYNRLPLLPEELEIVILKPPNTLGNSRLQRQFVRDYRVRRREVQIWLEFLKLYHPGYRDILIDRLEELPVDGSVEHRLRSQEIAALEHVSQGESLLDDDDDNNALPPDMTTVPNLGAEHQEIEHLRRQVFPNPPSPPPAPEYYLSLPPMRSTPIMEFNRSQPLLILAFPTLYPHGEAEFCQPRERSVEYAQYIEHLLRYRDPRFAQHPRFRFVVINTLMRQQGAVVATLCQRWPALLHRIGITTIVMTIVMTVDRDSSSMSLQLSSCGKPYPTHQTPRLNPYSIVS